MILNLLFLTTGLEQIMRNSRDSEELMTVWEGWRHVTGSDIRKQFTNLTTYLNKAVQYNGKTKYSTDLVLTSLWTERKTTLKCAQILIIVH